MEFHYHKNETILAEGLAKSDGRRTYLIHKDADAQAGEEKESWNVAFMMDNARYGQRFSTLEEAEESFKNKVDIKSITVNHRIFSNLVYYIRDNQNKLTEEDESANDMTGKRNSTMDIYEECIKHTGRTYPTGYGFAIMICKDAKDAADVLYRAACSVVEQSFKQGGRILGQHRGYEVVGFVKALAESDDDKDWLVEACQVVLLGTSHLYPTPIKYECSLALGRAGHPGYVEFLKAEMNGVNSVLT